MEGKLLKSEKSDNMLFQFSVFKNKNKEGGEFININIKKFSRQGDGKINFLKAQSMNFSVQDFEYFKSWIKDIKKKK